MRQDIHDLAKDIPDDDPGKELLLLAELLRESEDLRRRAQAMADRVDTALQGKEDDPSGKGGNA